MPQTDKPSRLSVRGRYRAPDGDTIERITTTLPASLVRALDHLVYRRKQGTRAYNRSALIQDAVTAYLESARAKSDRA